MNIVFILLYFQFSGIIVSVLLVQLREAIDARKNRLNTEKLIFNKRKNEQWLVNYFQEHPKKVFKETFPKIYRLAEATKRYKEINALKSKGLLTDMEYEAKLDKILRLVDISLDVELISLT